MPWNALTLAGWNIYATGPCCLEPAVVRHRFIYPNTFVVVSTTCAVMKWRVYHPKLLRFWSDWCPHMEVVRGSGSFFGGVRWGHVGSRWWVQVLQLLQSWGSHMSRWGLDTPSRTGRTMSDCFLIGSGEKEEFPPLYQHTFQKMVTVGQSHHMRQIWADGIMGFMHPKIFQRLQLDLKLYRSPRIHRVDFRHHPLLFLAGSSFKFPSMKTTDKLSYFSLEDSPVNQFHSRISPPKWTHPLGTSARRRGSSQLGVHWWHLSNDCNSCCTWQDKATSWQPSVLVWTFRVSPCFTMFHQQEWVFHRQTSGFSLGFI